jgi:hypothetical protein
MGNFAESRHAETLLKGNSIILAGVVAPVRFETNHHEYMSEDPLSSNPGKVQGNEQDRQNDREHQRQT